MVPPRKLFQAIGATQQSARDAIAAIAASDVGGSAPGPWASVLYVDQVRGNNTTAQRGNENFPFATIQAALNAMQTDDTVMLAPQLFTITATLTVPATVVRGSICGVGPSGDYGNPATSGPLTKLVSTTTDLWNFGANLGLTQWVMSNFSMRTTLAGSSCILADGSSYAKATFFGAGGGLTLRSMVLRSANGANVMNVKYAVGVQLFDVWNTGGNYLFTTGAAVTLDQFRGTGTTVTTTNDSSDPLAISNQYALQIQNGTHIGTSAFGTGVVIGGQTSLNQDETSIIGVLSGSSLSVVGSGKPACVCDGWIGSIDFASAGKEIPDTALVLSFIFQGARLYQNGFTTITPGVFKAKVGGSAVNFQSMNIDSTTTVPGATITADAAIHITGRGARWPNVTLATPGTTGDIIPPILAGVIDLSAGGAVAKTWVQLGIPGLIRVGAAPNEAFLTPNIRGADAAITVKSTTGLTFDSAAVANNACNWQAIWN